MNVYKTRWFDRWARKEGLPASSLCAAVFAAQALDTAKGLHKAGAMD